MPYRNLPTIAIQRKANGRLVPSVSGGKSSANQIEAVAECLLDNMGRAVRYQRLVAVVGRHSDDSSSRHLLRQYVSVLREMLVADKAPMSSQSPKKSVTCFVNWRKRRAIPSASGETRARRRWGEGYGSCGSRPA
jgi:hypothetical protein